MFSSDAVLGMFRLHPCNYTWNPCPWIAITSCQKDSDDSVIVTAYSHGILNRLTLSAIKGSTSLL